MIAAALQWAQAHVPAVVALFAIAVTSVFLATRNSRKPAPHAAPGARTPVIAAIGTANPSNKCASSDFLAVCDAMGYTPEVRAKVDKIVAGSGIESRFTCLPTEPSQFMTSIEAPGGRSKAWEENAPRLAVAAARQALSRWRHGTARDITHVVVHSCTGFSAPGLDFLLIQQLGLPSSTRKLGVNFMGCFGGFTALFVAKQVIEADATGKAVVLVVCAETCSAHMTRSPQTELIVGNTLFADGAGAVIVTHAGFTGKSVNREYVAPTDGRASWLEAPPADGAAAAKTGSADASGPSFEWAIGDMSSEIAPDSAHCMTWKTAAEPGRYDMWLDRTIPAKLAGMFATSGLSLLSRVGIPSAWRCAWAIHPGGKAIINAFETAFATLRIKGDGLEHSRGVLRDYGNMSSPTIFFVLNRVLAATKKTDVFFAGFGPGLTIEFGRLLKVQRNGGGAVVDASVVDEHADVAAPSTAEAAPTVGAAAAAAVPASGRDSDSDPSPTVAGAAPSSGFSKRARSGSASR